MKFAKITFWIAAIWGVLLLAPLLFLFDTISRQDPPPINHPGFYYGFATVGLAFQFVFMVIALDPVRFRPMMLISALEKFGYGAAMTTLYLQHRFHARDLAFVGIDTLFGVLFLIAYFKTSAKSGLRTPL